MASVANSIDTMVGSGISLQDVLHLHKRLKGEFTVIEPGRRVLKFGQIMKLNSRKQPRQCTLVLVTTSVPVRDLCQLLCWAPAV